MFRLAAAPSALVDVGEATGGLGPRPAAPTDLSASEPDLQSGCQRGLAHGRGQEDPWGVLCHVPTGVLSTNLPLRECTSHHLCPQAPSVVRNCQVRLRPTKSQAGLHRDGCRWLWTLWRSRPPGRPWCMRHTTVPPFQDPMHDAGAHLNSDVENCSPGPWGLQSFVAQPGWPPFRG